ncbi:MAG: DUF4249 domain-containing protein [Carboxylicivirga sp.]|jgi:hypothetical protein|nr:DUF4249 domain-containing protein [Carboxylicivirga sp.]
MKRLIKFASLLSFLMVFSCVKEISTEIPYELNYIVFGSMSNYNEKITVEVYQSSLLLVEPSFEDFDEELPDNREDGWSRPTSSGDRSVPVNDATVTLYKLGARGEELIVCDHFDVKKGVYTSADPIEGQTGETYWIKVLLTDGTELVSKKEELQKRVLIESTGLNTEGFLKVNFKDPESDRNLYLLETEFTYENMIVERTFVPSNDVLFNGNNNSSISIEAHSIPNHEQEKLKVYLSSINFDTFRFFNNMLKQYDENQSNLDDFGEEQNQGNPDRMFAAPSVSLYGNIINQTTGKRVLGNFSVLGSSRVVLINSDFPNRKIF